MGQPEPLRTQDYSRLRFLASSSLILTLLSIKSATTTERLKAEVLRYYIPKPNLFRCGNKLHIH